MTTRTLDTGAPNVRTPSWAPLAVLMTGTFVFVLDFFVVNVALPAIQTGLHAGSGAIEWIVAGYAVTTAALLVTGGRLGDHLGARGVFATGLGLFTAASAACALAPTAGALVGGRLAQGMAALGADIAERGAIGVDGPIREYYVVSPFDTDDESQHRTEVAWPVFRTATASD